MRDWSEWSYERLSDEEVEQLAKDIKDKQVITCDLFKKDERELIPCMFATTKFMGRELFEALERNSIRVIYAHMKLAGPDVITHGHPIFLGFEMLNSEDWVRVARRVSGFDEVAHSDKLARLEKRRKKFNKENG